jgi:hypothetical protein
MNTLNSRKLPNTGSNPGTRDGASLVFFNGSLWLHGASSLLTGSSSQNSAFSYDLTLQQWSIVQTSQTPAIPAAHSAVIYNNELYLLMGISNQNTSATFLQYNFPTSSWHNLGLSFPIEYAFYFYFQLDSKVYFVMGRSKNLSLNLIACVDLSFSPPTITMLFNNTLVPRRRRNHCMATTNNYIYIFGGVAEDATTYLNDLWRFDVLTDEWSKVVGTGNTPEPRASAVCTSGFGNLIVFGGYSDQGIFGDMYYFHYRVLEWTKLELAASFSPRYGGCVVLGHSYYLLFGIDNFGISPEISYYNYTLKAFITVQQTHGPTIQLVYPNCFAQFLNSTHDRIVVFGGEGNSAAENSMAYELIVNVTSETYTASVLLFTSFYTSFSRNAIIVSDNFLFILFGTVFNTVASSQITVLNLNTLEVVAVYDLEVYLYSFAVSQMQNAFYIFGGGNTRGMIVSVNSANAQLYKITAEAGDFVQIPCSQGTYGENCEFCEKGTYGDENGGCVQCNYGTFSDRIGGQSVLDCIICPKNSYNDVKGAAYCKDCPINLDCPMGSSSPIEYTGNFYSVLSLQPSGFVPNTALVNGFFMYLTISGLFFVLFISAIILLFKKTWNRVIKFDAFIGLHSNDIDGPLILRKTLIGGLFTVIFYISAGILILYAFVGYFADNITETQTLIPSIFADASVSSPEFSIKARFYGYKGLCGPNALFYHDLHLNYSSRTISNSLNNEIGTEYCEVNFTYYDLVASFSSYMTIELFEPNSYASYIIVNITSVSSIPGQTSSLEYLILPDDMSTLFKGPDYTVITISATPSVI